MLFVETPVFTTEIRELLSEEEYRRLQLALLLRPEQGVIIRGSGGLRKARGLADGRGKRGGLRIIYYWDTEQNICYMLFAYPKNAQEELTPTQLRFLSRLVQEEFK